MWQQYPATLTAPLTEFARITAAMVAIVRKIWHGNWPQSRMPWDMADRLRVLLWSD
jgi:hypothetical protein